jgi:hypothetical protein
MRSPTSDRNFMSYRPQISRAGNVNRLVPRPRVGPGSRRTRPTGPPGPTTTRSVVRTDDIVHTLSIGVLGVRAGRARDISSAELVPCSHQRPRPPSGRGLIVRDDCLTLALLKNQ